MKGYKSKRDGINMAEKLILVELQTIENDSELNRCGITVDQKKNGRPGELSFPYSFYLVKGRNMSGFREYRLVQNTSQSKVSTEKRRLARID